MNILFSPTNIGNLALANRIVIPPMCQYSAEDGKATDWHFIHYGHFSLSGAGLMIVEATAVEPQGRITYGDLGLWSDACESALARALKAARAYSSMPVGIQLAHAGRKASTEVPWKGGAHIPPDKEHGWRTEAPSAIGWNEDDVTPLALDETGLARVRSAFAAAAARAVRLGFDLIEVHGAHGYLLHQFLSPLSNARLDAYGGPLENRLRFPLEVFEAVRAVVPKEIPVTMRISAQDWIEGGWSVEESVVLGLELKRRGCACIHVSSGGLAPQQRIDLGPSYQCACAARIRQTVGLPVIAVGLITDPLQAETLLVTGCADMIAVGRGMLYNPRWPWHAAAALRGKAAAPPQYYRSLPHGVKDIFL